MRGSRMALACLLAACALLFVAGMPSETPSPFITQELSHFLFGRFTMVILIAGLVMCASILGALYLIRREA